MIDQAMFLERALIDSGRLTDEDARSLRARAQKEGVSFEEAIIASGALPPRVLAIVRADIAETPFVDLSWFEPNLANARLIPRVIAERRGVFPLFRTGDVITVAMHDPLDIETIDRIRQAVRCDVDTVLCERAPLLELVARAYALVEAEDEAFESVSEGDAAHADATGPVVAAVNQILADAAAAGASDIHINPDENELHLRYRVDGVLQQRQGPSRRLQAGIVQRIKVMADLDLTQTRRPQDGKFRFTHNALPIDVRVSVIPTVHGENVVLRLLAGQTRIQSFGQLGIAPAVIEGIESSLAQPYGMFLVTGPTGSGKTTTLYAALNSVNDPCRNIMTIEDPVEIRLRYVRQVQVQTEIGLTFASALRSILRQDPDVVLVGEIRDEETARIACQAALTGHLLLSTLHTNDAPSAVTRLRDFGIPSFIVNAALLGVLAQRLVRRIDPQFAVLDQIDPMTQRRFSLDEETIRGARFLRPSPSLPEGVSAYRGRVGIHELLRNSNDVRSVIDAAGTTAQVAAAARSAGLRPMWRDGLDKAAAGITTLDEVARAAPIDEDIISAASEWAAA